MSFPGQGPKRRKAEASSSKRPNLPTPTSQEEYAANLEVIGLPDLELMRCPICSHFPRKEVYVCTTGHSVCAYCLPKLDKKCPVCRAPFQNTRNYYAEQLLDSVKFQCSWMNYGCQMLPMERKIWTSHESQCDFNPNTVEFCTMVNRYCNYKLCPVSIEMDPVEMNVFLYHMRVMHDFDVQDVNLGVPFLNLWVTTGIRPCWTGVKSLQIPMLLKPIFRIKTTGQGRVQLYVMFLHFLKINRQPTVLIKCVRLTDENQEKISISFSLAGPERVGPKVPDIKWTTQPEGIRKLKDFTLQVNDLSSYHMIPVASIQNYITDDELRIDCVWNQL